MQQTQQTTHFAASAHSVQKLNTASPITTAVQARAKWRWKLHCGSFFLFGPRGTGKSTWLQQQFPHALRLDLLAPEVLRAYQARPERLRAICQLRANGTQLSFWRTRAGLEVDFVVYGPNHFQAIEVKRAAKVTSAELKGLRAFQADYPEAECLLLSFCPEPLLIDGIRCEPLESWLLELRP